MKYKKTENENIKRDAKTVAMLQLGGKKEGISSFQEHVLLICALHLNFEIPVWKLLLCPRTSLKKLKAMISELLKSKYSC